MMTCSPTHPDEQTHKSWQIQVVAAYHCLKTINLEHTC